MAPTEARGYLRGMTNYTWKHYRADPQPPPQPGRRVQIWTIPAKDDAEAITLAATRLGDLARGTDFAILLKDDEAIYVWDYR